MNYFCKRLVIVGLDRGSTPRSSTNNLRGSMFGLTKEPRRIQGAILIGIALFGLGFWKGFLGA